MITLNLHGHLEHKFGQSYQFEAQTVHEVLRAMQANFSSFYEELTKENRFYHVVVNNEEDFAHEEKLDIPVGTTSTVDLIPAMGGAANIVGAVAAIAGIALIMFAPYIAAWGLTALGSGAGMAGFVAAGGFAAVSAGVAAVGWGLALAGVASLLAPDVPKDRDGERSTSLSGIDNVVAQGVPVPVGYGRMLCGSVVLSAFYASSKVVLIQATSYYTGATLNYSFAPDGTDWVDWQATYGLTDAQMQVIRELNAGQYYTQFQPAQG